MARADLLALPFDAENTAQALMEPAALLAQVRQEAADLARGRNPFAGRKGDYWRVFKTGDRTIPVRVFCPAGVDASKPLPLIVAFHGSGGDENMFMDGYGAGLIKKLAAERKAVLATPRTEPFAGAGGAEAFDDLLRAVGADYPIDPKRVFVLGHSMGGMTTNALLVDPGREDRGGRLPVRLPGVRRGGGGDSPHTGRRRRARSHRQPGPDRAGLPESAGGRISRRISLDPQLRPHPDGGQGLAGGRRLAVRPEAGPDRTAQIDIARNHWATK